MKMAIWSMRGVVWTISIIGLVCVLGGIAYYYHDTVGESTAGEESGQNIFATHYELEASSCGSNCQRWQMRDIRTGVATELPFVSENGISFSATSTLIVENPIEDTRESFFDTALTHHWEWDGMTFTETMTYMENADGKIVDVVSKGNNMDPEWMWEGDCNYMEEIGYIVCQ